MVSPELKYAKIEILIAIASTVFGFLIGPLFEKITSPLFDTPTRALLVGLLFVALLSIISMITIGIFARQHEKGINQVSGELSSINRRLGLTVRFVHDPPSRSTGEVYRTAREIIEKSEKEILHFYYCRPQPVIHAQPQQSVESDAYRVERAKYTQAILDKIRQNQNGRFFYRRIFQFPEGRDSKFTEERVGKRWFEQVKAIMDIVDEYSDAAIIKKAPLFLQQTFFIVDERFVIWGIDAIDPQPGVRYYEGALFFDDPHQEFIQYLKGFFLRVDAHATIIKNVPEK